MNDKKSIRDSMLRQRDATTRVWRNNAACKISTCQIANHLDLNIISAPVAGYWPIGSEADPRPLMQKLSNKGLVLCLPYTHKACLSYHLFSFNDELYPSGFGTFAPKINTREVRPQTLLVPLVAFDKTGARLGWGKGFYDRSIAYLKLDGQPLLTIGVAFSFQQVDHIPTQPHDIALDYVITEEQLIKF